MVAAEGIVVRVGSVSVTIEGPEIVQYESAKSAFFDQMTIRYTEDGVSLWSDFERVGRHDQGVAPVSYKGEEHLQDRPSIFFIKVPGGFAVQLYQPRYERNPS